MKCIIPGNNVKVFGRAVHCLSKVGEDLYMEPLDTGLALRAVNSSRSAYSCFLFSPSFFLRYDDGAEIASQATQDQEETTRWRVTMKSCLAVFKSLSNLEKNVDRCNITLDAENCRLVFQLHCRHGIVKTYNLVYQETETLQAVFSKDLCPNRITAPAKLLAEAVGSFQSSQEEVTMTATPTQLGYKNYVDDEPDPSKVVHSELRLVPEEFTQYLIGVDTEVTFSLKDLRAILSFSDAAGLPVSINFETPGKPIVFSVESEQTLEATFVLATLTEVSSSQMTSASQQVRANQTAAPVTPHQRQQKSRNNPRKSSTTGPGPRKNQTRDNGDGRRMPNGHTSRDDYEEEFPDDLMADLLNRNERTMNQERHSAARPSTSSRLEPTPTTFNDDTTFTASPVIPFDSALSHRFQKTINDDQSRHDDRLHPPEIEEEEAGHTSPNRTLLANFMDENSRGSMGDVAAGPSLITEDEGGGGDRNGGSDHGNDDDDDDDEFNFIPGTPPSKKFKSMFFGASQSQQSQSGTQRSRPPPSQPHPKGGSVTVLAEDSDED